MTEVAGGVEPPSGAICGRMRGGERAGQGGAGAEKGEEDSGVVGSAAASLRGKGDSEVSRAWRMAAAPAKAMWRMAAAPAKAMWRRPGVYSRRHELLAKPDVSRRTSATSARSVWTSTARRSTAATPAAPCARTASATDGCTLARARRCGSSGGAAWGLQPCQSVSPS